MTFRRSRRVIAAVVQGSGALLPTLIFLSYLHSGGSERWRAVWWLAGPIALTLAFPLAQGSPTARQCSKILCLLYPIGPLIDLSLLTSSLHGGEVYLLGTSVMGLLGGALMWFLLAKAA